MSKRKLAGIIVACTIVIIVVIVLIRFEPWEQPYTLSVSANPPQAGSVSPSGGEYESGVQVTLTASPTSGYTFDHWGGGVSGTTPTITITMNQDYSITANFVAAYYLTASSTEGGFVTVPGEGTFPYGEGAAVNLVATPHVGYEFLNWTGDVDDVANVNDATTTITINRDCSITANFDEAEAVTFADPNLEAAIRQAVAIPDGPIYPSDLDGLTSLSAVQKNIANLTGVEFCISLTELTIWDNQISDIAPLANLTSLTTLYLGENQISDIVPLASLASLTFLDLKHNQISDISPLSNLTSLTGLWLYGNQIGDISPLADLTSLTLLYLASNEISDVSPLVNLTGLTDLDLYSNQIGDVSPLADLTNLTLLYLASNEISDVSPLVNLTSLTDLDLGDNQICDISPLVENAGLSVGDDVYLDGNPLSSDSINTYIPQLQAKGVYVYYL
jgi:hypothetical protein